MPTALNEGAPDESLAYLELLAQVLEDSVLSGQEWEALAELASQYEMSDDDVRASNEAFMLGLATQAVADGRVAREERAALKSVAALLDLPNAMVSAVLKGADAAQSAQLGADLPPLPDDWTLGEPLRVGQRVVLTGECDGQRQRLEEKSKENIRVSSSVSRKTAMLVTDGTFHGGKAAKAAEVGSRIVSPSEYNVMLDHVQPALVESAEEAPSKKSSAALVMTTTTDEPSPTVVRAWALANGYQVGIKGRVAKDVIDAFKVTSR